MGTYLYVRERICAYVICTHVHDLSIYELTSPRGDTGAPPPRLCRVQLWKEVLCLVDLIDLRDIVDLVELSLNSNMERQKPWTKCCVSLLCRFLTTCLKQLF